MNISKPKFATGKAIILAIVPILFLSVANAAIVITKSETNESKSLVFQTVGVALALIVGLIVARFSYFGLREIGFAKVDAGAGRAVLYFLPLVAVEAIVFLVGFQVANTLGRVLLLMVFTAFVGACEELFYRGLVFRYLSKYGIPKAIILSSVIFGVGHAAGLLGGHLDLKYVLLQILFAFVFGLAAACITTLAKSLWPAILWHFLHDFIAFITVDYSVDGIAFVILLAQFVILVIYTITLFKKIVRSLNIQNSHA